MTTEKSTSATGRATKVGLAGLGYWGPNLARNFDELAELAWLCETDEDRRARLVVDFRNATKGHEVDGKVWKL